MTADILIVRKKGGRPVEMKITQKMKSGYTPESYIIVVNLKNYKDLAIFLYDLKCLYSAPIDKAIEEYKSNASKIWPF